MMKRVVWVLAFVALGGGAMADVWDQAREHGQLNRRALLFCWRYSQGWLQWSDPKTGLLPHDLKGGSYWNAKDCAADNYPFLVITTFMTDRALFNTRMPQILESEQRLCNRLDRLPDDYDFQKQGFRTPDYKLEDLIFGASEYIKDGLIPLTEWVGPSRWSERMCQLMDDIWKNAAVDTEVGKVPSRSHEVAGDLLQALARMSWMTGNPAYKQEAYTLAAYFLEHHLPINDERLGLDDHGCEVIGGLSEVYFLASHQDPGKAAQWRAPLHKILDRVLEVGRDETGLLYNAVNPLTGEILSEERTDNWGYNYNAFATIAELDNEPRYREAVQHVLTGLAQNKDYPWEGAKADGFADTLEGGINLINRFPVPEAIDWADYTAQRLFALQRDTGVIEGWYGDGNSARTLIMYAQWKSLGAYVEAWRADLRVGAVRDENGETCFLVESDWPWSGVLRFDVPRHEEHLGMPGDYPRINQFPEWFTVPKNTRYQLDRGDGKKVEITAEALRNGLEIAVRPDAPAKVRLKKM